MKTSETISKIASALLRAQKNIETASKESNNPFYKSKYADLSSVIDACKAHLNAEGITVLQPVTSDGTNHFVETTLLHESGEFISSNMKLELGKVNMQELGSAVSYARRYGLQSLVFVKAEDDDAESTMKRPTSTTTVSTETTKPSTFKRTATVNPAANGKLGF